MNGGEVFDPKRAAGAARLLIILVANLNLRPNAPHQEPVEIAGVSVRDMEILVAEVDALGPVFVILGNVADLDLVNEGVPLLFLDQGLRLVGLLGPDEIVRERAVYDPQSGVNGGRVIRGAILAEQVFQDEHGHIGADFDFSHQVFADNLAREDLRSFQVECVVHG